MKAAERPGDIFGVAASGRSTKEFLDGIDDAKRKKDRAALELTAVLGGTYALLRYHNAKKKAGK